MLTRIAFLLVVLHCVYGLTQDEIASFTSRQHIEQNTGLQGTVSVKPDPHRPGALILKANGIPDHDTGTFPSAGNPNSITEQSYFYRVNKNPEMAPATSCLPMGPIGLAINGVAIYNPFTITCCDAGVEELDLFDMCSAHPGPSGGYHYHIYPNCLENIVCNQPSSILGVAFDGFPIYGPNDEFGAPLTKDDLDECNGKYDSQGNYRYHITKEYPYFMGCYKGKIRDDAGNVNPNCQCTEPVEVCTEFGGGEGGGPRPPPQAMVKSMHKRATDDQFECCVDEQTCDQAPESKAVNDDGNGAASATLSTSILVISSVLTIFFN